MTRTRDILIEQIWRGRDPFSDFINSQETENPPVDSEGWIGSDHAYFEETIERSHPRIIVEIGVWKGASALHMAKLLRAKNIDGAVIAVDTWLGSCEHWLNDEWFADLNMKSARATIQDKFMNNVLAEGLQDYIIPLPLDSINASELLKALAVQIDMVHIDAGHDYASVTKDIAAWWPLIRVGGILIGDDYFVEPPVWPEVKKAFDEFTAKRNLQFDYSQPKIRIAKPDRESASRFIFSAFLRKQLSKV
jgi:predicted O-methyltransferase YrrM